MERVPRLRPDDMTAAYPSIAFWKDRAIIGFHCRDRTGTRKSACLALPILWFYA